MPAKKKATASPAAKPTEEKVRKDESGIPMGRPAFPSNVLPIGRDDAQPAGAVQLQVPLHEQEPKKPGSSTLTIMNPTPIAAADKPPTKKRG